MRTADRPDVLVIGAGAAGLAAAATLRRAGKHVLVLEARNRCGGRLFTQRLEHTAYPVELGAEFLHGAPAILRDFVSLADPMPLQWWRKTHGKRVHADGILKNTQKIFRAIGRSLPPTDLSFEEAIGRVQGQFPKVHVEQARSFVAGFYAAPLSDVSAKVTVEAEVSTGDGDSDNSYRLACGYDRVLDGCLRALAPTRDSVRLGAVVRSIRWQRGRVEVTVDERGDEEVFTAPQLVVTVPISVLKKLPFSPALESKKFALEHLGMGPVHRVVLRFREPFWESRDFHPGYLQSPENPFVTFWTARPWDEPRFTCWSGGSQTEKVGKHPVTQAMQSLAAALDVSVDKIEGQLIESHFHNWCRDPFSLGAYSYVRPGGEGAREELAESVDETLYFAGEATCLDDRTGTVDGAIDSGLRAAEEILKPEHGVRGKAVHAEHRRFAF